MLYACGQRCAGVGVNLRLAKKKFPDWVVRIISASRLV